MKIVINTCYGGFSLSNEAVEFFGVNSPYADIDRQNSLLIEKVEEDPDWISGTYARLRVIEIPEDITDFEIDNYDGLETVTYVLAGKIHHVPAY